MNDAQLGSDLLWGLDRHTLNFQKRQTTWQENGHRVVDRDSKSLVELQPLARTKALRRSLYINHNILPSFIVSLLPLQDNPSWPLFPGQCPAPLVSVNKEPELWSPKSNREEPGTKGVCMPPRNQGRQRSLNLETVAKHWD